MTKAAGTAIVNGPPQYVQMVSEIARRLDENASRRSGSVIRVFKLKHAWAADHKVQIDGNTITVPGVATVLSNMYHVKQEKGGGGQSQTSVAAEYAARSADDRRGRRRHRRRPGSRTAVAAEHG